MPDGRHVERGRILRRPPLRFHRRQHPCLSPSQRGSGSGGTRVAGLAGGHPRGPSSGSPLSLFPRRTQGGPSPLLRAPRVGPFSLVRPGVRAGEDARPPVSRARDPRLPETGHFGARSHRGGQFQHRRSLSGQLPDSQRCGLSRRRGLGRGGVRSPLRRGGGPRLQAHEAPRSDHPGRRSRGARDRRPAGRRRMR